MRRLAFLVPLAAILLAWLVVPFPSDPVRSAHHTAAPAVPLRTPHELDLAWQPPAELCVSPACLAVGALLDPTPQPSFPAYASNGSRLWDVNLTLEGQAQPNGLVPTIAFQSGHYEHRGNSSRADAAAPEAENVWRTVASAGGGFPLRLDAAGLKLDERETAVRVVVWASGQGTGWSTASPWRLHGHVDGIADA